MEQPPAFTGWHRNAKGGPWEPVCSDNDPTVCLRKLIRYKPAAVPQCEKVVLREGTHP